MQDIRDFQGKYPSLIWPLFFSEMWERFCFYGMRGMLILFMINHLMMDGETANLQYGATQAFVYAFTFVGGLFADKIIGYRKSLYWGGFLMIIGSIILAINPKTLFFIGIAFTIIGTGFFKPNISTMVGQLYHDQDNRRDAGFSLFYAGINIGGLIGGYICIAIAKGSMFASIIPSHLSWNVGFGLAALAMIISLITFTYTEKKLGSIGLSPIKDEPNASKKTLATYAISLLSIPVIIALVSNPQYTNMFMYIIGPMTLLYLIYEMTKLDKSSRNKLLASLVFVFFSIIFWAFYEQSGGSLSIFAERNLSNNFLGITLDPNGVNNSANSLFVIIFASVMAVLWLWLGKKSLEPNTIIKFGLAFLFLALGFYMFYCGRFFTNENGVSSLNLFTFAWLAITIGELCLSPIGMSIMTKLSPRHLQGIMMGVWFLASAYGQYIAGLLGANIANASENSTNMEALMIYTKGYGQLALYALITGLILIVISPMVRKWMGEVK